MDEVSVLQREQQFWERHESFEWLTEGSVRSVISRIPPVSGDVLELCSGSGMFTKQMPKSAVSYTCLDLSETLLKQIKQTVPGVHTVIGDAMDPDLPEESFDYICIFAGLHHLPDISKTIRSIYRLMKWKGRFVCFEPNDKCWYRKPMKIMKSTIGFYTEDEVFLYPDRIKSQVLRAGFKDLQEIYITPVYLDEFLRTPLNRLLSRMMYLCGSISNSPYWQSFFMVSAKKV